LILAPTPLRGSYLIEPSRLSDERGFFARTFCVEEFAAAGLNSAVAQCSVSYNRKAGTLRGMHYQADPAPEAKLVRCTKGAIYDVVLDLRPREPTFRKWFAVELSEENRLALYVPEGMAHGFQTLTDSSEVFYQISMPYKPDLARGVRWDDPAFNIEWPDADRIISERDKSYPDFEGLSLSKNGTARSTSR
jgi:dTDP-4-dehydrorhamnose 3,5-epimerase